MPDDTGHFPHHKDVLLFLQQYANKFDLMRYIKFKHSVHKARKTSSGKWKVVVIKEEGNDIYPTTNSYTYLLIPPLKRVKELGKAKHKEGRRKSMNLISWCAALGNTKFQQLHGTKSLLSTLQAR